MAAKHPFVVGEEYRRRDVYRIIGISEETRGGNWETGYNRHEGDWFLFCNIGIPGRSGHDYPNYFVGDDLHWSGKTNSSLQHQSIQDMISGEVDVYVFTRTGIRDPFVFAGTATPHRVVDSTPVEVLWRFIEGAEQRPEVLPEEVIPSRELYEGATKTIQVNVHERNPQARRECVEYHGTRCKVCEIDLVDVYGDIARGFIHVHHLRPLKQVDAEYKIDPIEDLAPVCPNCHAMLHRRVPILSVEELRAAMMLRREST